MQLNIINYILECIYLYITQDIIYCVNFDAYIFIHNNIASIL